jgi:hypothetical protein
MLGNDSVVIVVPSSAPFVIKQYNAEDFT